MNIKLVTAVFAVSMLACPLFAMRRSPSSFNRSPTRTTTPVFKRGCHSLTSFLDKKAAQISESRRKIDTIDSETIHLAFWPRVGDERGIKFAKSIVTAASRATVISVLGGFTTVCTEMPFLFIGCMFDSSSIQTFGFIPAALVGASTAYLIERYNWSMKKEYNKKIAKHNALIDDYISSRKELNLTHSPVSEEDLTKYALLSLPSFKNVRLLPQLPQIEIKIGKKS